MAGSILTDTKKALGLAEDYTVFDPELINFINSAISTLTQLGVGPETGYAIINAGDTWDELIGDESRLNHVQLYVYLKVRMAFDPPNTSFGIAAIEKMAEEAEWRMTVTHDELTTPEPVPLTE